MVDLIFIYASEADFPPAGSERTPSCLSLTRLRRGSYLSLQSRDANAGIFDSLQVVRHEH